MEPIPTRRNRKKSQVSTVSEVKSIESELVESTPENSASTSKKSSVDAVDKPDISSYREKIKERFRLVKERAAATPKNSSRNSNHELNLKISRQENEAVENSLNRFRNERKCSSADTYNFFCENIDMELIRQADDYEVRIDDDVLTHYVSPEILKEFVEIAYEEKIWKPPRSELSVQMKVEKSLRVLEDEGLYVCETAKISHKNILEQRLSTDDKEWFNCEGNLKTIDNPQLYTTYRPQLGDFIETVFSLPLQNGVIKDDLKITIRKPNVLLLNISKLKFDHHPLFSLEHVFQQKLLFYYEKFLGKLNSNTLEVIIKRLESFRMARDRAHSDGSGDQNNEYVHVKEIKKLRNSQIKESTELRDLTKNILSHWRNVKTIRKKNGYSNTEVNLTIYKEKTNYTEDIQKQRVDIENMIAEIITEFKFEYKQKLNEYTEELNKWKQNKTDENRPKKPSMDLDEEDIRHQVLLVFKEAFRPPGEPILKFKITKDNEITKNEIENNNEMLRRQSVKSTKFYFKVFYNGTEVCKSKSIQLNDNFDCLFDEALSMKVNDFPDKVSVELYEVSLSKRKIGMITLKIPHPTNRCQEEVYEEFFKEEIIHYKHEGIGSGMELDEASKNFDLHLVENYVLSTNGIIGYNSSWEESNIEEENKEEELYRDLVDENGQVDLCKLKEWINTSNIDPLNPSNSFIFEYLDSESQNDNEYEKTKGLFKYNSDLQKLTFYSPEKINSNLRFQVLELRNKNEPEFLGVCVPNRLKEIPANILTSHNQRKKQERTPSAESEDDDIEAKRVQGVKCLKQLHNKVYQQCRSTQNNLTYDNIVDERLISYFQNLIKVVLFNFLNWFKIRPGINKPLPKLATDCSSEEVTTPVIHTTTSKIIVHVASATNIPHKVLVRKQSRTKSMSEILEEPKVFVEVSYETMNLTTSVYEGPNPKWDEKLIFPLRSKHIDYLNPSALNDYLILNIWNESNVKGGDSQVNDWLGNVKIPLSAVAHTEKLSGSFQVSSLLFLNYEHHAIYIQLTIWMEPNFPKFILDLENIASSEPTYLYQHITEWNKTYNTNYPHRKFSPLVIDYYGKTVCLTRFIKPLEPPQMNQDDFETTPEQCARYVQLIPFMDCNKLYDNISLCTEELLKLSTGTVLDHAITLTCYFLALNIDAYLLLGFGIPNGQTAFVLTCEKGQNNETNYYIFDVKSTLKYSVMDPLCPLQKLFCVINDENIFANIQRTNELSLTQFEFTRRSDWLPLFNNQVSAPTNSIQKKVNYHRSGNIEEFEIRLETKLKKKITKYRKNARTIWNHTLANYFKQHMHNLESDYTHAKYDISHLKSTHHTQQVYGFIVDLPYYDTASLFEIIKTSKIFSTETSNKDFALALKVHEYSNNVLAVWLLIGSVFPK